MAALQKIYDPNTHLNQSDVNRIEATTMWEHPYKCRRDTSTYGFVRIISCKHDCWWYASLIEIEVFCELRWRVCPYTKKKHLKEAVVVRLGKSQKEVGQTIDGEDVELL
jgi:hypothetical protein